MKANLCVVGAGYWGKNIVRILNELNSLYGVCDINPERLTELSQKYDFKPFRNIREALKDGNIQGFVIAVPASSLDRVALQCIRDGRSVFVEKPLSLSLRRMEKLVEISEKNKLILMGGYILLFNDALRFLKEWLHKEKTEVFYLYLQRLNFGIVREDVNVWWNLAPHDISALHFLFTEKPHSVRAWGTSFIKKGIEDVVLGEVSYRNGMKAYIHVSWIDPCKVRRMVLVSDRGMVEFDDTKQDDKIKIHRKVLEKREMKKGLGEFSSFAEFQVILRAGETYIPNIRVREPLKVEMEHFIECLLTKKRPLTDGRFSYDVLKVLHAGSRALRTGRKEEIDWGR